VSNALKFSPRGGVVTVRVVQEAEDRLRFDVVDMGPGIAAEKQAQLFGKFQQLDSTDARSKDGTGLGLAISQAIIEQHGEHIEVRSKPGHGATFTFMLPIVKVDSGSFMLKDDSRYNILTVTADAELSTRLRGLLSSEGYRAMRASSLAEAHAHLEVGTADALILSDPLPDETAELLARRLREERPLPMLPILVLTAHPQQPGLPGVDVLALPLEEAQLLHSLRHAVREPGPARVLVGEGSEDMRRALRAQLGQWGAVCQEAADGERAVELAREAPPDLIILEAALAKLDGFEVVDVLRQGRLRGVPLIVLTERQLSAVECRQLTLGPTFYIARHAGVDAEVLEKARELLQGLLAER
jgi:DNA-binding response OmpR family regulator